MVKRKSFLIFCTSPFQSFGVIRFPRCSPLFQSFGVMHFPNGKGKNKLMERISISYVRGMNAGFLFRAEMKIHKIQNSLATQMQPRVVWNRKSQKTKPDM